LDGKKEEGKGKKGRKKEFEQQDGRQKKATHVGSFQ
jgi:hypothetical protein